MPTPRGHIIQQVTIDVQRPTRRDSFELQQRFSDWFWSQGAAVLTELLDELAPPDVVLRLDELSLDLGRLPETGWTNDLEPALSRALRDTLRDQLGRAERPWSGVTQVADSPESRRFARWLFALEKGYSPWWGGDLRMEESESPRAIHATLAANPRAVSELLAVLRRSPAAVERLAGGYAPAAQEELLRALVGSRLSALREHWSELYRWFRRNHKLLATHVHGQETTEARWVRVTQQFAWHHLARADDPLRLTAAQITGAFLTHWLAPAARSGPVLVRLIASELPAPPVAAALRYWAQAQSHPVAEELHELLVDHRPPGAKKRATAVRPDPQSDPSDEASSGPDDGPRGLPKPEDQAAASAEAVSRPTSTDRDFASDDAIPPSPTAKEQSSSEEADRPDPIDSDDVQPSVATDPSDGQRPAEELDPAESTVDEDLFFNRSVSRDAAPPEVPEGTVLYLQAAGVVLLHPFLAPLFTNLGYWQDGAFADDVAWQRAVWLTHYLATATEQAPEEDLVLPKLLCGRAFELPVLPGAPLTDTEKNEADDVLRAVIKHWGAIGAASPAGLREGFFAREGKLVRGPDRWELTVERKGQDLLLGRLPWGLSLVRLPWLEEMIYVTW